MSRNLALGQSKEPRGTAKDVTQVRGLLLSINNFVVLISSLGREHNIVRNTACWWFTGSKIGRLRIHPCTDKIIMT